MENAPLLSVETLQAHANDPEWLGYGWTGTKCHLSDFTVALAEQEIVARAETLGWTTRDLYAWANSKLGRWTADALHGLPETIEAFEYAWRRVITDDLIRLP